jgi:hypothetical protein
MQLIPSVAESFFSKVSHGEIEIYNECSLQHEFGIAVRAAVEPGIKVQFERNVSHFRFAPRSWMKKEIDLSIFRPGPMPLVAVEFKFPRAGQHPEQMFKSCQDIAFLEQLVSSGFGMGYFIMAAEDPLFYEPRDAKGIYSYFRGGAAIHGAIMKPTGKKDETVIVKGQYPVVWRTAMSSLRWFLIQVTNGEASRT